MKKNDHVDLVLQQWAREKPEMDASPMAILGRLVRTNNIISAELQRVFAQFSLNSGEFDVLATLLRSGAPYTLTPNRLLQALMLSSGAMTNRVDKLESKGLVERQADPNDRRGVLVKLTDAGHDLISDAVQSHVNRGEVLLDGLSKEEQDTLAQLLKKFLLEHETVHSLD